LLILQYYIKSCPGAWKDITIHHLLTHTSGIPDFQSVFWLNSATEDEIIQRFMHEPLEFKAGERYGKYSNTGYILLGAIIEQASGRSYPEFLQENIFDPVNMTGSGYELNGDIGTVGYLNDYLKTFSLTSPKSYAAGWMHSTAADLFLWDKELYTDRLIQQKSHDEMFTAQSSIPEMGAHYGYGIEVGEWEQHRLLKHGGQELGFVSLFERFPDDRVTIILLSNDQSQDMNSISVFIHIKIFTD